ncbi:NAD(P)-dependent glycerol-3-phosphate dehydrogenase [candidate division KSB1 bacterium]|nr:NAD(P)-dependent glycerol-3-phosphate dehydrogenase [candidate division KSB1 bacterium]
MKATILGAGNWGTTLAVLFARQGHEITLYSNEPSVVRDVTTNRVNARYLPDVEIPSGVRATSDRDCLASVELCFLAVPVQHLRGALGQLRPARYPRSAISLSKGIEQKTLARVSQIIEQAWEGFSLEHFAALSGPTLAGEIAAGMPATAVVASTNPATAERVQAECSGPQFRLYSSDDLIGVELAGALKNVIALAAGVSSGLGLGQNAIGALITRGLAEMTRLGETLGGKRATFAGLAGMGDLVTTCSSPLSRNRTVGERIGRGESLDQVLASMTQVAEGVWTARAALELAAQHRIEMPITTAVSEILFAGKDARLALRELMMRSLKSEN